MTTLNVTCKRKDWDRTEAVLLVCFVNRYVNVLPEENLEGGNQEEWPFNELEWIDFGTTRWYPSGK